MTSATASSTSPARPASRPLGSFASRALVAAVLTALFAGLVWADATHLAGAPAGCWLLPAALLAAGAGAAEAVALTTPQRRGRQSLAAVLGATAIVVAGFLGAHAIDRGGLPDPLAGLGSVSVAVCIAIALAFAVEISGYRSGGGALARAAAGSLAAICLGMPFAFMLGLRLVRFEHAWHEPRGANPLDTLLPLVSFVAVVKAGDIAAYLFGSLLGRTRMAPILSPGKTWEGALAGLAGSVATAWLVLELLGPSAVGPQRPWGGWPVYGLLLGSAGIVGDLCESLVKRECGVKDSGRWLGGLGGMLDLVDSLLLAAPVAWLLWMAGRSL